MKRIHSVITGGGYDTVSVCDQGTLSQKLLQYANCHHNQLSVCALFLDGYGLEGCGLGITGRVLVNIIAFLLLLYLLLASF